MFNMNQFEPQLEGKVNFNILDVTERVIPTKNSEHLKDVLDLLIEVTDFKGKNYTVVRTRIFKERHMGSEFYQFAQAVNKVFSADNDLNALKGSTGNANLYYSKNYPRFNQWVFHPKDIHTNGALGNFSDVVPKRNPFSEASNDINYDFKLEDI